MKNVKIPNSPFNVVKTDENKVYVTLGNKAVLECKTEQEARKKVFNRDYELLINTMYLVKHTNFENNETETIENA